jgi:hypothetical protein
MELKRYLRVVASTGDDDDDYSMVEISNRRAREAADRIEKLEAALREIIGALNDPKGGQHVYDMRNASYIARKALEGTPDMSVYKEGYRAVEEAMGHPSPEFWVERKYDR